MNRSVFESPSKKEAVTVQNILDIRESKVVRVTKTDSIWIVTPKDEQSFVRLYWYRNRSQADKMLELQNDKELCIKQSIFVNGVLEFVE